MNEFRGGINDLAPAQQWSRVCREPDCWWCGPSRDTDQQAIDDLADHMEQHYREDS